jgi:hypothetical protein
MDRLTPAEWQAMIAGATPADVTRILADLRASGKLLPLPGVRPWLSPEQVEALPSEEMREHYRRQPGMLRDRSDVQYFPEPVRGVLERLLARLDAAGEARDRREARKAS